MEEYVGKENMSRLWEVSVFVVKASIHYYSPVRL